MINLIIQGKPIAKARPRFFRRGNFVGTYNVQETEEGRFLHDVKDQYQGPILDGPLKLKCAFLFERPKCHFGTGKNAGCVKPSSPKHHTKKPDLDNLVKFVKDCLNRVVWKDDAQVIQVEAKKKYNIQAMTLITIEKEGT